MFNENPSLHQTGFQHQPGPALHPVWMQPPITPAAQGSRMNQALGVKTTKCLSVMLLISGIFMMIMQIVCMVIVEENHISFTAHAAGTGIWCGMLITTSGILGCCSASKKTNALVITFLVLNILCTLLFAPIMIGTTGGDLDHASFCRWIGYGQDCSFKNFLVVATALMLLDALIVFVLSICAIATNSSAIQKARGCACCCSCCDETSSHAQAPVVIYLPANQIPSYAGQPTQLYMFPNQAAMPANFSPPLGQVPVGFAGQQSSVT